MKHPKPDSEDALELEAVKLFEAMGWQSANALHETFGAKATLGRQSRGETVLLSHLMPALERLNPDLPAAALEAAAAELTRDRSTLAPANANREVMGLLRDGVPVLFKTEGDEGGESEAEATVRVIDWSAPPEGETGANDYLVVQQFWIQGETYKRRPDLVGFVNGLPLVFVELKAVHKNVEDAYRKNLSDYKDTIPHIFWHNALVILSNGLESLVGSTTARWEHFVEWKKISSEEEAGLISMETVIRGTCQPARLLDLAENFAVYQENAGGLVKLLAKNHQFLGVNNAIEAVRDIGRNQGKLGVFWHTQGSGKSLSMIFFAQKVLRKMPGDWTFLILTDRDDLDDQIYGNFARAGVVTETEKEVSAQSGAHLKHLLQGNHRYIFSLIQKFHLHGEADDATYPELSDRSNIIVMTDEAHRSQYDLWARNLRAALPNAAFIGFTGTPLIEGEGEAGKTREVFGDYVSIYSFRDAVADRATVPLFYDNRIPELQLTNADLNEEMEALVEAAVLDEGQEKALEREFKRQYHLITREERLDTIARDLVQHFMTRGNQDKAMVLSIDKATTVKMFDKVQREWQLYLADLRAQLAAMPGETASDEAAASDETASGETASGETASGEAASGEAASGETATDEAAATGEGVASGERVALAAHIAWMEQTDMAVVISGGSQGEVAEFAAKGLNIERHRQRMNQEDLEAKFKDENDPFRIVFVCAMWIVGFDVPCCSTIYLDKPLRNHSLMQAIARVNRLWGDKTNGLIVDYIGVFRNLQDALRIYATGQGNELPIRPKSDLVKALALACDEATTFCVEHGFSLADISAAQGIVRLGLLKDAVEAVAEPEATKKLFMAHTARVDRLFKAILPDAEADSFRGTRNVLSVIAERVRALTPAADISDVMAQVDGLLDKSVAAQAYQIQGEGATPLVDLSQIDFDKLEDEFRAGRKNTETAKLKGALSARLQVLVRQNRTRMDYLEQFQAMIEDYNAGSSNIEQLFAQLTALTRDLQEEEKRHLAESLSEEELAVFDLLTRPNVDLTEAEKKQVKALARELLSALKGERLTLDWRKAQGSRAAVRLEIEQRLDDLPAAYDDKVRWNEKVEAVYQHIYDSYAGQGRSVYGAAS